MVFVSTMGGLFLLGATGIVIGPIIGALFTTSVLGITGAESMNIGAVAPDALRMGFDRTFYLAGMFMILPLLLSGISLWYSTAAGTR